TPAMPRRGPPTTTCLSDGVRIYHNPAASRSAGTESPTATPRRPVNVRYRPHRNDEDQAGSGDREAAVDGQGDAGDVAGRVRGEEHDRRGEFDYLTGPRGGDEPDEALDVAGRVRLGHLRGEEARCHRVDPDA